MSKTRRDQRQDQGALWRIYLLPFTRNLQLEACLPSGGPLPDRIVEPPLGAHPDWLMKHAPVPRKASSIVGIWVEPLRKYIDRQTLSSRSDNFSVQFSSKSKQCAGYIIKDNSSNLKPFVEFPVCKHVDVWDQLKGMLPLKLSIKSKISRLQKIALMRSCQEDQRNSFSK